MQSVDDDEVQSTYREACRLTGMVCLRKASDGDVISREEIKRDLMLLLSAHLERNVEIEHLMKPPS